MVQVSFRGGVGAAVASMLVMCSSAFSLGNSTCFCAGDYDQSGTVDGSDLGVLLGQWGNFTSTYDLNGDNFVDGTDLGILLSYWGACESIANDVCANAQLIDLDGITEFCSTHANTEGPAVSPALCDGLSTIYNDLWFQVDVQSAGYLTVSTCAGVTNWDPVIAVYGSTLPDISPCPTSGFSLAPLVACNDDNVNTLGCTQLQPFIGMSVAGGKSYKIRVGGHGPGDSGAGALRLQYSQYGATCTFPVNAPNNQAVVEVFGTTVDNDVTSLPSNCFGGQPQGPAEWIRYTPTCTGTLVITTCHPATDFDTVLNVMKYTNGGFGCPNFLLGCNDDSAAPNCQIDGFNRRSRVEVSVTAGEDIYIVVSGYSGASGNYGVVITRVCN
ncbi:MAG: hypothetical protein U0636_00290 [Phycisphaerales bacterium]